MSSIGLWLRGLLNHNRKWHSRLELLQIKYLGASKILGILIFGWTTQSSTFTSVQADISENQPAYKVLEVKITSLNKNCEKQSNKRCHPVLYRISSEIARSVATIGNIEEADTATWLLQSSNEYYDKDEVLKRRISLKSLQDLTKSGISNNQYH